MRRTGRKITLGLIVIVLGAGVLLKIIPPEADVALNDQHLVSIDGTLVTNPLDLSEVTQKSLALGLEPIVLPSNENPDAAGSVNDGLPNRPSQTATAFFPPLGSPTRNHTTDGNSPSNPPSVTAPDGQTPGSGNDPSGNVLPPVLGENSGDNGSGATGGGTGSGGSPGGGGNGSSGSGTGSETGSGSGSDSGAGGNSELPPSGAPNGDPNKGEQPNESLPPLPTLPPVDLGTDEGSIPGDGLPLPLPDPVSDQPPQAVPELPTHSVPDGGGTLALLAVAAATILPLRKIGSNRTSKAKSE